MPDKQADRLEFIETESNEKARRPVPAGTSYLLI